MTERTETEGESLRANATLEAETFGIIYGGHSHQFTEVGDIGCESPKWTPNTHGETQGIPCHDIRQKRTLHDFP
ncbi:hypothetical protein I308_105791 [Cryptococcus tetragattii IND107]|uniref:Uncharacterized protein n=1 Tax=Cryptococcus tetragattii IND107 TaxID=1296105 RepID=A0ABR3BLR6_9TREE